MSDDSYFGDDLFLDDDLIAVLDAEEEKHLSLQPQAAKPAIVRHTPPPLKKQKINHDWSHKPAPLQHSASVDDFGDLPEISIQGDGTYGVAASSNISRSNSIAANTRPIPGPSRIPPLKPVSAGPSSRQPPQQHPIVRRSSANQTVTQRHPTPPLVPNAPPRQQPQPLQPRASGGTTLFNVPSQGRVEQRTELAELRDRVENRNQYARRVPSGDASRMSRSHSNTPGQVHTPTVAAPPNSQRFAASQARSSMSAQDKAEQKLKTELSILRAQMEEISKKEAEARQELEQARNARFAKEGEVKILRSNIDKLNQQHENELTKMKAAKEAAEAMQAQLKQTLREELDRVKTHYTFRQHELETSSRRTPLTSRISRMGRNVVSSSPIASSQMRQWNAIPSSQTAADNPARKLQFPPNSPKGQRTRVANKPNGKPSGLPGFQSGFDSTPIRYKGKGKERETHQDDVFIPPPTPQSPPSSPTRHSDRHPAVSAIGDVPMVDAVPFPSADLDRVPGLSSQPQWNQESDVEMAEPVREKGKEKEKDCVAEGLSTPDPPDWKGELHHILFTHHPRATPSELTIHLVLHTNIAAVDQSTIFTNNAHRLLEALGTTSVAIDLETHLNIISSSLVAMTQCLTISCSITPLIALLDLIRTITYSIPSFVSSLLSISADHPSPQLLITICNIVAQHLNPKENDFSPEECVGLAEEVFRLLETLCWTIPDDLAPRLSALILNHDVIMAMTSPKHTSKTLISASRALAFLASHRALFRHFLTLPRGPDGNPLQDASYHRLPQIEQLAAFLTDSRSGPDALQLRENVLTFFATLATAHPDALTILSQSYTLIPHIIMFLSNIASPLWEDDVELMASPERIKSVLDLTTRTISLLYILVCSQSPKVNLNEKLQTNHRIFNGIQHVFHVTFGRFTFADPPEWLDEGGRIQVEQLTEMARELLEIVVEGPELDMIWASFQLDLDGSKKVPVILDHDEEDEEALVVQ
ncbi:hypothetical protein BXZ70DRAFT_961002 [Cristinia sonorae]|uniref:DNA repair protein Rad26 n=1 Tax=Cristinia sonorae TaxID=1940300 RepID=A0A8K0UEW3_9AGAR|nr:hypothetical protein BXZ70DRAFT_961002 [Cristinia sonorae]